MKEITAIIRPKKIGATKDALANLGFPGVTVMQVLGRGHQRGIAGELNIEIRPEIAAKANMKYIPKRLLTLIVNDEDADVVVDTIIKVNQSAQIGDGKIFVSTIDDAVRVRTNESGTDAII